MPSTYSPALPLSRLSRDAQQLVSLARSLAASGSQLEDNYWETRLSTHLNRLLVGKKNQAIEAALEFMLPTYPDAYEILIELAETLTESTQVSIDETDYDVLLFTAPAVVWTRYQLPQNYKLGDRLRSLATHFNKFILADGARLALLPELISFEQMPQSLHETLEWTQTLGRQALAEKPGAVQLSPAPDMEGMLADARFVVGAIAVPKGEPLFRWQNDTDDGITARSACFADWEKAMADTITPMFAGCSIQYLKPDAFYVNNREADRRIRPLALQAAVTWLQSAAGISGRDIRAVIVGCGHDTLEEYRIGISTRQSPSVIYGCVWPILSKEEAIVDSLDTEQPDTPDQIAALLKEFGIGEVRRLPGLYAAEFCEDCGAPYFPSPLGEMQHPELPEEIDIHPLNFH